MSAPRLHIGIGVDQNLPWATLVERWRLIEAGEQFSRTQPRGKPRRFVIGSVGSNRDGQVPLFDKGRYLLFGEGLNLHDDGATDWVVTVPERSTG